MRGRSIWRLTRLLAVLSLVGFPLLAWQEARRQAFDSVVEMTSAHARAVLHRADKTAFQAQEAIATLARAGQDPCSPAVLATMRHLDLTSTYVQAVGFVRGDTMVCSSMGQLPFSLGKPALRTSTGVTLYLNVPGAQSGGSPLMALERDHFAVLVHRELPLDISTAIPGISLAVLHLESSPGSAPELSRGHIDRKWLARLAGRRSVAFADDAHLVGIERSSQFLIAAVAAVPIAYLDERTRSLAGRLVPAGVVAGVAVAVALLSLMRRQQSMASALRYALRRNEFSLQYQPIFDLASGQCTGVEALLRWKRATGEQIGPDLFIPVAEQTGIISRLTERVLQLVEADVGDFLARHPAFHIALNLSPADLRSTAIVDLVDGFLQRSGANAGNLILEITERGFLDRDSAVRVIGAFHARGIEVAIDDFGTGYSSLSYLETLELDFLKIDRSFIETVGTTAPTSQVVSHIIAMARTLNLRMIAEGIETPAQASFLKDHGVQYGQGWLYGRPMAFADAALLAGPALAPDARSRTA